MRFKTKKSESVSPDRKGHKPFFFSFCQVSIISSFRQKSACPRPWLVGRAVWTECALFSVSRAPSCFHLNTWRSLLNSGRARPPSPTKEKIQERWPLVWEQKVTVLMLSVLSESSLTLLYLKNLRESWSRLEPSAVSYIIVACFNACVKQIHMNSLFRWFYLNLIKL